MVEETTTTSSVDLLDRAAERVQAHGLRFERAGFYVIASILAWRVFWELADRNHDNPHAQTVTWVVVCLALWIADNF